MTDAEKAYAAAQKAIAEAKASGAFDLNLSGYTNKEKYKALDRLPPEIADLKDLKGLTIWGTQISDISALQGMTGLTRLHLSATRISDISALQGMTGLTELDLSATQISDISALRGMTRLTSLFLSGTQVSDISVLQGMKGLTGLILSRTQISDISVLKDMTGMTELDLSGTQISDISALQAMTGLNALDLARTQVSDISVLQGMKGLTGLYLPDTQISDISALQAMTGLNVLDLARTQISDISVLKDMTGLTELHLSGTQISDDDMSMLAGLSNLTALNLSETNVLDLRPLGALRGLASELANLPWDRLRFKDTAATRLDPRIAEIAEIEDNAERARVLFDYLKDWVPPGENPAPPSKPDPIFETILIDGKLELADDLPSLAEQAEPLKKVLHQRLQSTVPDLARAAGNVFPKLAAKARVLAGLVDKPFAELDLLAIHLEVEVLQDRLERGSEDGVPFPGDVLGPLADVTRTGPGLTLGHESVDLYITRVREARETPLPEAEEATHRALSQAMVNDPAANGPNSIAMENRIAALEDQAQRQAGWKVKHKWLVYALPAAGTLLGGVSVELIGQNFGPALSTFIANNATLLSEVAATYGGTFFNWFCGIMGPVFLALGVKDALKKGKH